MSQGCGKRTGLMWEEMQLKRWVGLGTSSSLIVQSVESLSLLYLPPDHELLKGSPSVSFISCYHSLVRRMHSIDAE